MNIHELPGYYIENDDMPQRYAKSLRASLDTKKALFAHIDRWRAIWEIWVHDDITKKILNKQISDWTFKRLKTKGVKQDFTPGKKDKTICDLLVPPALLKATVVAKQFDVPFCTALHKGFCKLEDHFLCF